MTDQEVADYLDRLKSDFTFFVGEIWRDRRLDRYAPLGWPELELTDFAANGPPRRGILAPRKSGKALALDTPIPTPSGWTTMGEIEEGDEVFDENGKRCVVTLATLIMYDRPCYRVSFSDGTSIVCDGEHLWRVSDRYSDIKHHVLTTEYMKDRVILTGKRGRPERRYRIEVAGALDCREAKLPIDPYVLGIWLGDGSSNGGRMYFHQSEGDYYAAEVEKSGYNLSINPKNRRGNTDTGLIEGRGGKRGHSTHGALYPQLAALGLLNNKHIPPAYLRASVAQRLALLQGIMDTDGFVDPIKGACEIVTVKPALRDGYMELVRSLGLKPVCGTGRATINGRDCGEKYRVCFHAYKSSRVVRMPRKLANLKSPPANLGRSTGRYVVSIDPVPSVPVRCIMVNSPSHLYLAGEGMIPTHNTTWGAAALACFRLLRDPNRRILIISRGSGEAIKTVHLIKEWLRLIWFLQDLAPQRGDRNTKQQIDVHPAEPNRQPSVAAIGSTGQLPGNRAHTIIADDVETPQNTRTAETRESLALSVNEFEQILYASGPDETLPASVDPAEIIYFGTYHAIDSLYLKEADKGYVFMTMPLLYPQATEKQLNLAPGVVSRMQQGLAKPGDRVFERFAWEEIAKLQARGRASFLMQQQLVCDLGDSNVFPLRLHDLMVMDIDPQVAPNYVAWGRGDVNGSTRLDIATVCNDGDGLFRPMAVSKDYSPYQSTKAGIDPSGKGDGDAIGYAAIGALNATLFIKTCTEFEGGYSNENLRLLAKQLRRDRATEVYIESNYGGGLWETLFEPVLREFRIEPGEGDEDGIFYPAGWSCTIVYDTKITYSRGQKELRIIDTLEPLASGHRLAIDTKSASRPAFQERWTLLRRERDCLPHLHDLDALSLACRAHMHALGFNRELATERTRETKKIEDHQAFLRRLGIKQPSAEPRFYSFR